MSPIPGGSCQAGRRGAGFPCLVVAGVMLAAGGRAVFAQEMEPRRWTHLPVGTTIAGIGYIYTEGDLKLDPVIQVEDARVQLQSVLGTFHHYFDLADLTA